MIDFSDHLSGDDQKFEGGLKELFERLDRAATHTELRPSQQEAIEGLSGKSDERDLVLKVSTGAGKTVVGLLYAYWHMRDAGRPGVYLCSTRQLVDQAVREAKRVGIKAVPYLGGDSHAPLEGVQGKAVIVCTYDKLFNARSQFDRPNALIRPCVIVLDDAHAGVETARGRFTLSLEGQAHKTLCKILASAAKKEDPSHWASIESEDPQALWEVPFWIWQDKVADVREAFHALREEKPFVFVWDYLAEQIEYCRCVMSGTESEIIPFVLPVRQVAAFDQADHRLFMSATLADDSVLVRELGCAVSAVLNPIEPSSDRGLGERMILVPGLIDPDLPPKKIMKLCDKLSEKVNVAVLCPSLARAAAWEEYGGTVYADKSFEEGVEALKSGTESELAVFAQRYDGVDLPDDACRVLVIDQLPIGQGLVDRHDSGITSRVGGMRHRLVQRIEQGLGRAVRSHADYAVVLLFGPDLATFLAQPDVRGALNPVTRRQISLGFEISKLIAEDDNGGLKAMRSTILQCLKRDENWKAFYRQKMKGAEKEALSINKERIAVAQAEREAFELACSNDVQKAEQRLAKVTGDGTAPKSEQAVLLQTQAAYTSVFDRTRSYEIQRKAHRLNANLRRPPGMAPIKPQPNNVPQAECIAHWLKQIDPPNAALVQIDQWRNQLDFDGNTNTFEQVLADMAVALGAVGTRPEKQLKEGPDVLWRWNRFAFVIEAKSGNQKSLHKKDAGQLHTSVQWFTEYEPTCQNYRPVVVAKVLELDKDAKFPSQTKIAGPDQLDTVLINVRKMIDELIRRGPLFWNDSNINPLIQQYGLTPEAIYGLFEKGQRVK